MDDPRWIRLIIVGLVLAALVVGYMIFSGGFVKSKSVQKNAPTATETTFKSPNPSVVTPIGTPSALLNATPSASPAASGSAYDQIAGRSQSNVQTLPNTGIQVSMGLLVSLLAIISGWSLRKFTH